MKTKLPLSILLSLATILPTFGQIKIEKVTNTAIVKFANESHLIAEKRNDFFSSIRIYTLGNLPGSAGYPNGEISENIYVAVSEWGESPLQNLFCISDFYGPKFLKWDNEKEKTIDFIIYYGPADKLKTQRFEVAMEGIQLK